MKHYIIILTFFIAEYGFTQEKQNNATWDETIEFIRDNVRMIRGKIIWGNIIKTKTIETTLSFDKTTITVKNKSKAENYTRGDIRSLNLFDLSYVDIEKGENYSYIILWAREKGMVNCKENYGFSPCNFIEIGIENRKMKQRVLKAFRHLAYLSNTIYTEKKTKSKF